MLNDAKGFRRIVIACGQTDLRRGIDGLAAIVQEQFNMSACEKDVLFLFCGTRSDRIKGLVLRETDICCSINGLAPGGFVGQGTSRRRWRSRRSSLTG